MQFVWFYVPGPDDGLELKLSMRSVRKNFVGPLQFTVIGDKPKWYKGHCIPVAKVVKRRSEQTEKIPYRDTQNKIVVAANHTEISDEFCWISDDVYFLNPINEADLKTTRFDPWYRPNSRRPWQRLIGQTLSALKAKGYSTLQSGTHLPHYFDRQNLLRMFEEFDYPKNLYLFEILYSNRFCENMVCYKPFLVRLQRPETVGQLDKRTAESHVLNYVSSCWNKTMKAWLQHRYSEPTEFEG